MMTKIDKSMISHSFKWLIPVLLMALLAPWTPYLDKMMAEHFYYHNLNQPGFVSNTFTQIIYTYGLLPGQITGLVAGFCLLLSFFSKFWNNYKKETLFLALALIIGPGLIVNATFKDHWGRPRPKQVIDFGGTQEFRPFYHPNFFHQPEPSKSFPCGHCSTGYYFFALGIIGSRLKKIWLKITGYTLAFFWGSLLGVVRMAQGGHFFSDVLGAALIIWLVTLLLEKFIYHDS